MSFSFSSGFQKIGVLFFSLASTCKGGAQDLQRWDHRHVGNATWLVLCVTKVGFLLDEMWSKNYKWEISVDIC